MEEDSLMTKVEKKHSVYRRWWSSVERKNEFAESQMGRRSCSGLERLELRSSKPNRTQYRLRAFLVMLLRFALQITNWHEWLIQFTLTSLSQLPSHSEQISRRAINHVENETTRMRFSLKNAHFICEENHQFHLKLKLKWKSLMSCWTIKSGKNEIIVCSVRCVLFAAMKVWENGFGETMRLETKLKRNETISFS